MVTQVSITSQEANSIFCKLQSIKADPHLKVFYGNNSTCVRTAKEYTIEAAKLLSHKGMSVCLSLKFWTLEN